AVSRELHRSLECGGERTHLSRLHRTKAWSVDADVCPAGHELSRVIPGVPSEERVLGTESGGRKEAGVSARIEMQNLLSVSPNGRGRADDFRGNGWLAAPVCAEHLDQRLVKADHRTERTGNQVELVLDDEPRRPPI